MAEHKSKSLVFAFLVDELQLGDKAPHRSRKVSCR
jgi:hypothetical protein